MPNEPEELQVNIERLHPSGMLRVSTVHNNEYATHRYDDGYTEAEALRHFFGVLKERLIATVKNFACLVRTHSDKREQLFDVRLDTDNKREALLWFGKQVGDRVMVIDENGDIVTERISSDELAQREAAQADDETPTSECTIATDSKNVERMLNMLESLLSITGRFKPEMSSEDCDEWQKISAATADMRSGENV